MEEKRGRGRPKGKVRRQMSTAEIEVWINDSIKKILKDHLTWSEYIKWAAQEKGLSLSRAESYWKICWETIREKVSLERELAVNKHLYNYWTLYDQAIQNNDLTNARQTLNDIAKMTGLNESEKLDIKQKLEIKFKFDNER